MEVNRRWVFFTFLSCLSIYWTVNLILWFPWSISATLGMTLMLTVAPFIWAFGIFQCLKKFRGENLIYGAILTSLIYIFSAVVADFIFFGIIRNAMKDLYHPTTLYGYLFLIFLPFLLVLSIPKLLKKKENIERQDFIRYGLMGILSILMIFLIIKLNITV
jgi:hypothetical protein